MQDSQITSAAPSSKEQTEADKELIKCKQQYSVMLKVLNSRNNQLQKCEEDLDNCNENLKNQNELSKTHKTSYEKSDSVNEQKKKLEKILNSISNSKIPINYENFKELFNNDEMKEMFEKFKKSSKPKKYSSLEGGASLNLYEADINTRIEKITDYKRASFDQFKLSFEKSNIKRQNIDTNRDDTKWILTKFYGESKNKKHAAKEEIERVIFKNISDKDKITFLLKTLKKLEYLITPMGICTIFKLFLFKFEHIIQKMSPENERLIEQYKNEALDILKSTFETFLEFIVEKKEPTDPDLIEVTKSIEENEFNKLSYLYAAYTLAKNLILTLDYNIIDEYFLYAFRSPSFLDSNNLCSIFNGLENTNIPACNKYILGCILSSSLKTEDGVLIQDPDVPIIESKVPSWSKCKEFLEQSDFWEIANKDIAETPPIIILTVLLVLRFKITETDCKDADGNSFLEFETVKSWLNDTLLEQLTQEIPNEDEREKTYNNIKNNTKLIEFLNLYLEAVPHEFLNTKKTLAYCDPKRINNLKHVPQFNKHSIRDKLARAIARLRIESGTLQPQPQIGGGKNNNNLYFHAISHQLYNLNKSLNLNKKIQKGGFDENINFEDGSNLQISLNYLLTRDDMPSYYTALKGLVDTLNEIQPMTSELKEKLNKLLQETYNNEMKAAGLRVLLAHVISLNKDNKDITYDSNTIKKLGDKFGKKIEASKESVSKTIEILKANLIPLYNSNTGSNLYFVHNPFLHP
jgi:hypothetical protein